LILSEPHLLWRLCKFVSKFENVAGQGPAEGFSVIEAAKIMIDRCAQRLGLSVLRLGTLQKLSKDANASTALWLAASLPPDLASLFLATMDKSQAERWQDLLALSQARFKRNGYFVEFGANDGISISNTYLLEKEFGWTGILAEPLAQFQEALREKRPASHIEADCVWSVSGETVSFNEPPETLLATVETFRSEHRLPDGQLLGRTHQVQTISLLDMLDKHKAPRHIDFLSVDTEGSEYEILRTFDFSKYTFSVIVCEHNFAPQREPILDLLTSHGYRRVFEAYSENDDFYVWCGEATD
jgi:FkbM family methyltransferase